MSRALALRGYVIVSGLARGVDTAAHAGALAAGGRTIAVLAHGLDVLYPPENRALAERIVERGALLSEYPPGEGPLPWRFPRRNRWIAALSLGVLVIEAGEKSGSLGTARAAIELGREVFVAPGPASAESYRGAHRLLQEGAKLVVEPDDIVAELAPPWRLPPPAADDRADALPSSPAPTGTEPPLAVLSAANSARAHAALRAGRAIPYGIGQILWLDDATEERRSAPSLAKPERLPKNDRQDFKPSS
jgi:DNA processing protein